MYLFKADLEKRGIPFTTEYLARLEKAGRFPKRVRLSHKVVGWIPEEVDDWERERNDARSSASTRDESGHVAAAHLRRSVEELELSARAANCLRSEGIVRVGDLVQKTEAELLRIPHFGRGSLEDVRRALGRVGLVLGMELANWPPDEIAAPVVAAAAV